MKKREKLLLLEIRIPNVGVFVWWENEVAMEIKALQPILYDLAEQALGWHRAMHLSGDPSPHLRWGADPAPARPTPTASFPLMGKV